MAKFRRIWIDTNKRDGKPGPWRQAWARVAKPFRILDHLHGEIVPVRKVAVKHRLAYRRTLIAAAKAARDCGVKFRVNSSYRSYAEQAELYAAYMNGEGNLAARPGTSRHEQGNALDLSGPDGRPVGGNDKYRAALKRHGFVFAVPSEPWHVEHR